MIVASHSQARLNERRESNLLTAWHQAVNPAEKGMSYLFWFDFLLIDFFLCNAADRIKHMGKQVIDSALNQRIKELHRQDSNSR
jgi:hypothetical protein